MIWDIPERRLDPPEDRVFCCCDHCGGEIYEGDEYYEIDGDCIHMDCLHGYAEKLYSDCRKEAGLYERKCG